MAFIEPMHRNKPNITYLHYFIFFKYSYANIFHRRSISITHNSAGENQIWLPLQSKYITDIIMRCN